MQMLEVEDMAKWEKIKTMTLAEDAQSIVVQTDNNGKSFRAKAYAFCINIQPSAETTANTNAYARIEPSNYVATYSAAVRT